MCGIVGLMRTEYAGISENERSIFDQLLHTGVVRGHHGTGIFAVDANGNVRSIKSAGPPFHLVTSKDFPSFWEKTKKNSTKILVGHNRLATTGEKTTKNAHPFISGHITLVHNGTLDSDSKINLKKFDVDSEALCHAIAEQGIEKAIGETLGAYALVFFDNKAKTLNFLRNGQRPLAIAIDKTWNRLVFASEIEHLKWIIGRNNMTGINVSAREIPTNTLLSFALDEKLNLEERPLKGKERVYAPVGQHHAQITADNPSGIIGCLDGKKWNAQKARWEDEHGVPVPEPDPPVYDSHKITVIQRLINQQVAKQAATPLPAPAHPFPATPVKPGIEPEKKKCVYPNTKDYDHVKEFYVSDMKSSEKKGFHAGHRVDVLVDDHVPEGKTTSIIIGYSDNFPNIRFQFRVNSGGAVDAMFEAAVVNIEIVNILLPKSNVKDTDIIVWGKEPRIVTDASSLTVH